MNIPLVDLKSQYESIKEEIDSVISEVISKSAFIGGQHVKSFESAFAEFCNVKHCIGVGNGTDALFIALKALGIGEGDEVITVANSFIATSEAITMTGAKVVFVDINPQTYNIDVTKIEEKITDKTRAIIPVHLYGQPADMDPILNIAKKYNLIIIEDACQAHGAEYLSRRETYMSQRGIEGNENNPPSPPFSKGGMGGFSNEGCWRKAGSLGKAAAFSFYPGKNLGAYGDAGAIVTNDDELALTARMFANHGRVDKYDHEIEGVNSRMDGLQAAILGVKLKYLPQWTESRRKNAYIYNECLKGTDLITPFEIDEVKAVYHLYVVRLKKELRKRLQEHLKTKGISTGIHYPIALPNLKAYAYLNHNRNDFPEATKASQEIVSLPIYPELTEEQIQYIAEGIKEFNIRTNL